MNLTDIYTTFHPNTTEYTLFSKVHGNFIKTEHELEHKISLNKYKKTVAEDTMEG